MKIRWTMRAISALAHIHDHIAEDNLDAAGQLRDRMLSFVEDTLASHPSIGRPGRVDGTRESVIHPSYVIVYRVKSDVIDILTVRHTAQKWPDKF